MATSAQRRLDPREVRRFGSGRDQHITPDLTEIQTESYHDFLQNEVPPPNRKDQGIESVLREIFPVESYDKTLSLEYVKYELGKPRYTPEECRQLRLTYGMPFRVWLRLNKEEPVEEEVYLGDIPIMMGGGEFIINGPSASWSASCTAVRASISSWRRTRRQTVSCRAAGSFPSEEAGSR